MRLHIHQSVWCKSLILILSIHLFVTVDTLAQTFTSTYGYSTFEEGGNCLLPIGQDTLVVGGYRNDSTVLLFLDANGNYLFSRSWKVSVGNKRDQIRDLHLDSDGMIVGLGMSIIQSPLQNTNGWAFRYDYHNNNILWMNRFDDGTYMEAIVEYPQDTLNFFGSDVTGPGVGDNCMAIKAVLSTGNIVSQLQYESGSADDFYGAIEVNGDFYVADRVNRNSANSGDMRAGMTRLEENFSLISSRSYFSSSSGNAREYGEDMALIDSTHVGMAAWGNPSGSTLNSSSILLGIFDLNSNQTLGMGYNIAGETRERAYEITRTPNGIVLQGLLRDNDSTVFLMGTDLNGIVQWCRSYPNQIRANWRGNEQVLYWNNSLYVTGSQGVGQTSRIVVARLNPDGTTNGNSSCMWNDLVVTTSPKSGSFSSQLVAQSTNNTASVLAPIISQQMHPSNVLCQTLPPQTSFCFIDSVQDYTEINPVGALTGNNVWSGKVHIPANTIVVVDGSTTLLDITNVDLVFGQCAGIRLQNGAKLRANNSVLRVCDETGHWNGIEFVGAGNSQVNHCTFKNAEVALDFKSNGTINDTLQCQINSNLFSNNRIAIRTERMVMTAGINGNDFNIDGSLNDYSINSCQNLPSYQNEHMGIQAMDSDFQGRISLNNFINSRTASEVRDFRAIYALSSSGIASQNRFSNVYRGVELSGCAQFSLENNTFEVTQNFFPTTNQIRVSGNSNWIWIVGNQLYNSQEEAIYSGANAGIYVESSNAINIKENHLEGFSNSIFLANVLDSQVDENEMLEAGLYGLFLMNGENIDVSCNYIDLKDVYGQFTCGIGFFATNTATRGFKFRTNCIFNTQFAVLTYTNVGANLPQITNNMFFSYRNAGLYNIGCVGDLGTAASPVTSAGRNTFSGNNIGTSATNQGVDVFSNVQMSASGNFNLIAVQGPVFLSMNATHKSNASCGRGVGLEAQEILQEDLCDLFEQEMDSTLRLINKGQFQKIQGLNRSGLALANSINTWTNELVKRGEVDKARDMIQLIGRRKQVDEELVKLMKYNFYRVIGSQEAASELIRELVVSQDLLSVLALEQKLTTYGYLNQEDRTQLYRISGLEKSIADLARELLQLSEGNANYVYRPLEAPEVKSNLPVQLVEEKFFTLYPNPGQEILNIHYSLEDEGNGILEIYEATGKLLRTFPTSFNLGTEAFDMSALRPGIYLIALRSETKLLGSIRWIKVD